MIPIPQTKKLRHREAERLVWESSMLLGLCEGRVWGRAEGGLWGQTQVASNPCSATVTLCVTPSEYVMYCRSLSPRGDSSLLSGARDMSVEAEQLAALTGALCAPVGRGTAILQGGGTDRLCGTVGHSGSQLQAAGCTELAAPVRPCWVLLAGPLISPVPSVQGSSIQNT